MKSFVLLSSGYHLESNSAPETLSLNDSKKLLTLRLASDFSKKKIKKRCYVTVCIESLDVIDYLLPSLQTFSTAISVFLTFLWTETNSFSSMASLLNGQGKHYLWGFQIFKIPFCNCCLQSWLLFSFCILSLSKLLSYSHSMYLVMLLEVKIDVVVWFQLACSGKVVIAVQIQRSSVPSWLIFSD